MAVVVSKRYATLHELETVYSFEDLLDLYEIAYINMVNEEIAYKKASEKHGR